MKTIRHRRLLIALIVIIVAVLAGVAWLIWPEPPPKDLTLRLKFVRSEVVDGKAKLLFRVEGADQYEIYISGFWYNVSPLQNSFLVSREFYADPPLYSHNNDQGWKMLANVSVLSKDKSLSKLYEVTRNTWLMRKNSSLPIFSLAKALWQNPTRVISTQVITSDVITNSPVRQFPDSDFWFRQF